MKYFKPIGLVRRLASLYLSNLKNKYWYQYFPVKPKVVNLNANDICNSKCVMCNIWEQKQGIEVTPSELEIILKNELYSEVTHVGITGGEPTLREDLAQLYQAVINALPNLKGLSIITNCIKEKDVINRIEEVAAVCNKANKSFTIMVSLDGVGEVHDRNRGRKDNFRSAINVINHFKDRFKVDIGCTITKENVWDVDELLDYLKEHNLYGRFRVAEFIKRLYNDNKSDQIRNYTEDEAYHLALFFKKLEFTFEKNKTFKRTYSSIHNILTGGKRLISCPYQSGGVVLNSRGELSYCAPKSDIIGNTLENSSFGLFKSTLKERRRIIKEDCDSCIHDYHAPITHKEYYKELKKKLYNIILNIENSDKAVKLTRYLKKPSNPFNNNAPVVFIFGWYGTETVGDKAILGGIIDEYRETFKGKVNFIVGSLYPFITDRTLREMNEPDIKVIDSRSLDFLRYSKIADYFVMGGGPLMDLNELYLALIAFKISKSLKRKTTNVVFGCGIGPLFVKKFQKATEQIISLTDDLRLRDNKSVELAKKWCRPNVTPSMSGDSAKRYVLLRNSSIGDVKPKNVICCFLREWTHEYARNLSKEEFLVEKRKLERSIANLIREKAKEYNVDQVILCNMHNYVVGNDDRDFSRRFIKENFQDDPLVTHDKRLATVDSTIIAMKEAKFNICMRFHSMLFAESLDTDFMAIDYTLGGKIYNYLNDNNKLNKLTSIEQLIEQYN